MPSASYSFLDVAVLDDVRERFAAGDALVILSTDLEDVIWANGPGAALFGYADIEAIIGASARLGFATKRQISATRGFPAIGRDRAILVRMTTGMSSRAVAFLASAVKLPDGETAILLAAPAAAGGSRSEKEIAERAIGGFAEAGHFVAFVDAHGAIEAASSGFEALGITAETLAGMVAKGRRRGEPHRQAHDSRARAARCRPAWRGSPTPGICLSSSTKAGPARMASVPIRPLRKRRALRNRAAQSVRQHRLSMTAPRRRSRTKAWRRLRAKSPLCEVRKAGHDGWYFSTEDSVSTEAADAARKPAPWPSNRGLKSQRPTKLPRRFRRRNRRQLLRTRPRTPAAAVPVGKAAIAPEIDRASGPVRFVWRTDAEGKFSQISPEFSRAVGAEAADIVGRRFEDVANAFGLDPAGEIAGLLARRDTWSGRSVLWPIAGTDLKIPVDLAALPVYDRARTFEGFRGFGVARTGDAVVDPEGIGLALVTVPPEAAVDIADAAAPNADAAKDTAEKPDPFRGEVPALTIVPMQERRFTDKVIRLAEHRQPPANDKGLSTGERIAFQQIGERLKKDSGAASPETDAGEAEAAEPKRGDAALPDQAEAAAEAAETAAID